MGVFLVKYYKYSSNSFAMSLCLLIFLHVTQRGNHWIWNELWCDIVIHVWLYFYECVITEYFMAMKIQIVILWVMMLCCLLRKYQHFEVMYYLCLWSCGMFRLTYHVAWCHKPCDHSLNTYCLVPLRDFICVELEAKLKLTWNSTVKD